MIPYFAILVIAILFLYSAIKILNEYERGVIFRLGRVIGAKGPGLILLIPMIDKMVRVDLRVVAMDVPPQDVITRDNVSVKVNAVLYFRVLDPNRAIITVENYLYATSQLAQTTLRSVCGQGELDDLLSEREKINMHIQEILDKDTDPWGIKVAKVEIKHIDLPQEMQRAMGEQAGPGGRGRAGHKPPLDIHDGWREKGRWGGRAPSRVHRRGDPPCCLRRTRPLPARGTPVRPFSAGHSPGASGPRTPPPGSSDRPAPRGRGGSPRARQDGRDPLPAPARGRFDAGLEPGRQPAGGGERKREALGGRGQDRVGREEDAGFPDRRLVPRRLVACGEAPPRQDPYLRPQRRDPGRRGRASGGIRIGRIVAGSAPHVPSRGAFSPRRGGENLHRPGHRHPAGPGL